MKLSRRALIASALATPAIARAQGGWRPDRQITMIVAFAAGGGTDLAARTIARFMEADLGQSVVVLNRPGAFPVVRDLAPGDTAPLTLNSDPP